VTDIREDGQHPKREYFSLKDEAQWVSYYICRQMKPPHLLTWLDILPTVTSNVQLTLDIHHVGLLKDSLDRYLQDEHVCGVIFFCESGAFVGVSQPDGNPNDDVMKLQYGRFCNKRDEGATWTWVWKKL